MLQPTDPYVFHHLARAMSGFTEICSANSRTSKTTWPLSRLTMLDVVISSLLKPERDSCLLHFGKAQVSSGRCASSGTSWSTKGCSYTKEFMYLMWCQTEKLHDTEFEIEMVTQIIDAMHVAKCKQSLKHRVKRKATSRDGVFGKAGGGGEKEGLVQHE